MCSWMFASLIDSSVNILVRPKSPSPVIPIESVRIISRTLLRQSPRKRSRKRMPTATTVEQLQYQLIPDQLELRILKGPCRVPRDDKSYRYLSVDNWFNYPDLKLYYGPSNIVHVIRFVEIIQSHIRLDPTKITCLLVKVDSEQSLNALLLATTYLILQTDLHPKEAISQVGSILCELTLDRYKTEGDPMEDDLPITILDCLYGIKDFTRMGLLNLSSLDVEETMMREHPLNGDMNWVIPGKILALAGPTKDPYTIDEFVEYAKSVNIKAMVRLNRVQYDASILLKQGINHHEMFIHDGHIPTWEQIERFYRIANNTWDTGGGLAVHCQAGLGRTGTMIATFLIRKFNLQATIVIAFLRMMRPGSVLGMQARFLDSVQYLLRGETPPNNALAYLKDYFPNRFHEPVPSKQLEEEIQSTTMSMPEFNAQLPIIFADR